MYLTEDKKEFDGFRRYLRRNRFTYEITKSGSTCVLRSRRGDIKYIPNKLPVCHLHFINEVRNTVLQNAYAKRFHDYTGQVDYFKYGDGLKRALKGTGVAYEADLSAAYWHVAKRLGFIDAQLYRRGLRFKNKKIRLIALGSMAKKKDIFCFKHGWKTERHFKTMSSRRGKQVWYLLCKQVEKVLTGAVAAMPQKDFVFYWVDGIVFFGAENMQRIAKVFEREGFSYKARRLYKVRKERSEGFNVLMLYDTKRDYLDRKGRPFPLLKKQENRQKVLTNAR